MNLIRKFAPSRISSAMRDGRRFRRLCYNWTQAVAFRVGIKRSVILRLKSGRTICVPSRGDYWQLWRNDTWYAELLANYCSPVAVDDTRISLTFKGKRVHFYHGSLPEYPWVLYEQFVDEQYRWLRAENSIVLDIGGFIGDSAVYFALHGASRVITLEPYPYNYALLKRNITLNALQAWITPVNAAVGADGATRLDEHTMNLPSGGLRPSLTGVELPVYSLASLIQKYGIQDGIAKIDCEGGEYDLLHGASDADLRVFRQIMIEYHQGTEGLPERLKSAGFRVSYSGPVFTRDPNTGRSWNGGIIKARRIDSHQANSA